MPQGMYFVKLSKDNKVSSFKVIKLNCAIDTGSNELNGMLFPLFYWVSVKSGKNIMINFNDENKLELKIENNLARMILAYFK